MHVFQERLTLYQFIISEDQNMACLQFIGLFHLAFHAPAFMVHHDPQPPGTELLQQDKSLCSGRLAEGDKKYVKARDQLLPVFFLNSTILSIKLIDRIYLA